MNQELSRRYESISNDSQQGDLPLMLPTFKRFSFVRLGHQRPHGNCISKTADAEHDVISPSDALKGNGGYLALKTRISTFVQAHIELTIMKSGRE